MKTRGKLIQNLIPYLENSCPKSLKKENKIMERKKGFNSNKVDCMISVNTLSTNSQIWQKMCAHKSEIVQKFAF